MEKARHSTLDTEIRIIDAQLELLERREAEIETVLCEMRRMQYSVAAERKALAAKRRELDEERQPISWIPPEILVEIFAFMCSNPDEHESAMDDHATIVNLTHTCSKWRSLVISTSRLWSFIYCPCTGWNEERVSTLLQRSGDAPLDVIFGHACTSEVKCTPLSRALSTFQGLFVDNLSRLRYLSVNCIAVDCSVIILKLLNDNNNQYPLLSTLNLAVTRPHSASFLAIRRSSFSIAARPSGVLKRLRLHRIPPLSLAPRFYTSLTSLDISIATVPSPRPALLCDLLALLSVTAQLVQLSLSIDTVTIPLSEGAEMDPIVLPYLKQIDLNCVEPILLPRLFSHINAPALYKMELWLTPTFTTYASPSPSESRSFWSQPNLHLTSLKDLSLQFVGQDQELLGTYIRNFTFPVLERLEIVNTDPRARKDGDEIEFPPTPRLEAFFRDPRFPLLTHLSLSHFQIEISKVEALLGYIPALISLSLDTIKNCQVLIDNLALKAPQVAPGQIPGWTTELEAFSKAHPIQRRMKFCPRLETLSLRECSLNVASIWNMLKARNDNSQDEGEAYTTIRQFLISGSERSMIQPARRVIKPLRRTKLASQSASPMEQDTSSSSQPAANVLASHTILQAMHASATQPSSLISYMRLAGCRGSGLNEIAVMELLAKWCAVVWSD